MAVAVLYLAVRISALTIPSHGAQRAWWQVGYMGVWHLSFLFNAQVMCPGVNESDLQTLSVSVMNLYESSDLNVPSD